MANIWKGSITNKDKFEDFSIISGKTLSAKKYSMQVIGACYLCDKETMPEDDEGFLIDTTEPFTFEKKDGAELYVKAVSQFCKLNIAE